MVKDETHILAFVRIMVNSCYKQTNKTDKQVKP